jgi:hypothetical protein
MQHKIGTKLRWLGDPKILPNGIYTVCGHTEHVYNRIVNEAGEVMLMWGGGWECDTKFGSWELVKDVPQTYYLIIGTNNIYGTLEVATKASEGKYPILEVVVVAKHSPETTVVYRRKEI